MTTQAPFRWLAFVTGVAALGGFLFGYDTAVIAGAIGALARPLPAHGRPGRLGRRQRDLRLPARRARRRDSSRTGSAANACCWPAPLLYAGSGLWSAAGRRRSRASCCRASPAVWPSASRRWSARPTSPRSLPSGAAAVLGTLFQLGIVVGIFLVFFVNQQIQAQGDVGVEHAASGWRWMLGSESIPALVFLRAAGVGPGEPALAGAARRSAAAEAVLAKVAGPSDAPARTGRHPRRRRRRTGAVLGAVRAARSAGR